MNSWPAARHIYNRVDKVQHHGMQKLKIANKTQPHSRQGDIGVQRKTASLAVRATNAPPPLCYAGHMAGQYGNCLY